MGEHMFGVGMGFGWIFMAIFWILIILGVVFLIRWFSAKDRGAKKMPSLEILKERYARGEIDKKEFEEKKHDLQP